MDVKELLGENFEWPENLRSNESYVRMHDDHDGTFDGMLHVTIGPDGDAWVKTTGTKQCQSLRFRTHGGGGSSLLVRNALVLLAEAIRLESEHVPGPASPPRTDHIHRQRG